ncbi:MAG: hypothetical protein A2149_00055 [Candidatus Schekmanbacteria bacterium RBG_16_38_11]|uniref:Antitoxin n=1 Tax=Candidatus Schekmanbacteria bacterium RBG_16_38_11 TaxID=1817880 RepID=A0A1F7RVC8_9BACT|nr:MAG: hypothetical protein A2149_00055 [Candidatus Schekmanbacteria bacterium RBG_16_38_11]
MRTTINIPDSLLEEVISATKGKSRTESVVIAMKEYIRMKRKERLLESSGKIKLDIDLNKIRKKRS